jgi:uracil-DNA glycosylase family 4
MNTETLETLKKEVLVCKKCALRTGRHQVVFGSGNPQAPILLVGEAPGFEEDKTGVAFVGKSGQLLEKILAACNFSREKEVYMSNIVKCRPPHNRVPSVEEQAACFPFLQQQIEILQPKIIVLLGSTALKAFFGSSARITRQRGQWQQWFQYPVMPTYHPSALLRNPNLKRETWEDFKKVILEYRKRVAPDHYCQYI